MVTHAGVIVLTYKPMLLSSFVYQMYSTRVSQIVPTKSA